MSKLQRRARKAKARKQSVAKKLLKKKTLYRENLKLAKETALLERENREKIEPIRNEKSSTEVN